MAASGREQALARGVIAVTPTNECDGKHEHIQMHTVEPARPNYGQLCSWIAHCQSYHSETCNYPVSGFSGKIKLIDCFTKTIITPIAKEQYFALSYVWGPSAMCSQCSDELKKETLKQTTSDLDSPSLGFTQLIADAIEIVKQLNGRYLWVDKHCINQHDEPAMREQIRNMHHIYEDAVATIIPIDAACAHDSIPGVSAGREPQLKVSVESYTLTLSLPNLQKVAGRSIWQTRGWTYQELVLSRRCLFFSKEQVHYLCCTTSCSENLDKFDKTSACHKGSLPLINPDILYRGVPERRGTKDVAKRELHHYYEHVTRFKTRNLSKDSDSFLALQGLISRLGWKHLWGVAIDQNSFPNAERYEMKYNISFARGLYWVRDCDSWLRPIPNFPSWSWTGWIGPIARKWSEHRISDYHECFMARFSVLLSTGSRVSIEEATVGSCHRPDIRVSRSLICEGTFLDISLDFYPRGDPSEVYLLASPGDLAGISHVCDSFQDPIHDLEYRKRLQIQICLGLVLYRITDDHACSCFYRVLLLLLDETGRASRIGDVNIFHKYYDAWPKSRRTIELI